MAVKIIFWSPTLWPTRKDFFYFLFFLIPFVLLSVFLNFMSEGSSNHFLESETLAHAEAYSSDFFVNFVLEGV